MEYAAATAVSGARISCPFRGVNVCGREVAFACWNCRKMDVVRRRWELEKNMEEMERELRWLK